MWKSSEFCEFSSNWECDHEPNFLSAYTVIQRDDEWSNADDSANHPDSSFITCSRNENSCPLEISCACKTHHGVSIIGVEVRSHVHTIELYSDTDGYLQTVKGSKEGEDGSFCCKAKLEKCVDHLTMKFMGLGERLFVRIYRLHFVVIQDLEKTSVCNGNTGMVNMSKVRGFLHSMGNSAPEGGTKLMHAVEEYQQSQMSQLGRLSSALNSDSSDGSSVLSNLLTVVNRSHGMELSNLNTPKPSGDTDKDQHETKAPGPVPGGPLAAMLMSMSGSQDRGQEDSGKGGMFEMLQNICGKVSKLRVAEHSAETGAENEVIDGLTKSADARDATEPEIGASNSDAASHKVASIDLGMLQTSVEQTVSKMLQSTEDKMMKYIDFRLDAMETKINQKLDSIIQLLQKNGHPLTESNAGS